MCVVLCDHLDYGADRIGSKKIGLEAERWES